MNDGTSSDDIIDERIRALAAGHFNAPEGQPPREAMWDAIAAARRAARAAGTTPNTEVAPRTQLPTTIEVTPLAPRRSHAATWRWGAALAAGLVLGIAVDRYAKVAEPAPGRVAVEGRAAPPVAARQPAPAAPQAPADSMPPAPRRDLATRQPITKPVPPSVMTPEPGASRSVAMRALPDSAAKALYRTAAAQTLVQAEALLTAYRADEGARDPQSMQQAARWARDVLSSTRLLIDSPAGRDPQMRALFTDLELILAQLVQLSGTPLQANERELIERAMRERDLLPRLRSAVPAGLAAS